MRWFGGVGIALLGIGAVVGHTYHVGIGLGILAGGVILIAFGMGTKTRKELITKT